MNPEIIITDMQSMPIEDVARDCYGRVDADAFAALARVAGVAPATARIAFAREAWQAAKARAVALQQAPEPTDPAPREVPREPIARPLVPLPTLESDIRRFGPTELARRWPRVPNAEVAAAARAIGLDGKFMKRFRQARRYLNNGR